MGSSFKDYLRLLVMIAAGLSLLVVLSVVCLVVWDRLRANTWLTNEMLYNIRTAAWSGRKLELAREVTPEPEQEKSKALGTLEEREWRVILEAERIQHVRGRETRQIEAVSTESLHRRIRADLDDLKKRTEAFELRRSAWRQEQEREKIRVARLAGATYNAIMKTVEPEIIARDWLALYKRTEGNEEASKAKRRKLLGNLAGWFKALSNTRRAEIAEALDPELRLAITEMLRREAVDAPRQPGKSPGEGPRGREAG